MIGKSMKHLVFVYGTLKKGHGNNVLLGTSRLVNPDVWVSGRMCSLGGCPGWLGPGEGRTYGELYEVSEDVIRSQLDRLEGYREDDPESSFYIREEHVVYPVDKTAYVYRYNGKYGISGERYERW